MAEPDIEISEDGKSSVYHYARHLDPTLESQVDAALERMKSEPDPKRAAALLLTRWFEQGYLTGPMLGDLLTDYFHSRVKARAKGAKK